jgi:kynurenine formamidase
VTEIIDLSQELYTDMPVFSDLPGLTITMHVAHEAWDDELDRPSRTPAVNKLEMGEHVGTHVDALSHMARELADQSIDQLPLDMFYTPGLCLDLAHKGSGELIEASDLAVALHKSGLAIEPGDTVLIYTDHYRRAFGTPDWARNPGLSAAAARWLGEQGIAAFGVESMAPGLRKVSNKAVHRVCGELGFTHYENLVNLHRLIGRGRFRFIGLPLKIRGGTGSPVRAVAVFEDTHRNDTPV